MFPRREFTAEDLDKTLLELELTPSASIVLLPVSENSEPHDDGWCTPSHSEPQKETRITVLAARFGK